MGVTRTEMGGMVERVLREEAVLENSTVKNRHKCSRHKCLSCEAPHGRASL